MKRRAPLKVNPEALAAWRRRSKRLAPRSAKVEADADRRWEVRSAVFARDAGCLMSGRHPCAGRLTPHHLLKAGQGGPYTEANLVALCENHNSWVEDYPKDALALGLVVRGDVDHEEAARRREFAGLTPRRGPR